MQTYLKFFTVSFFLLYLAAGLSAQNKTEVRETEEEYVTYPFSDPNPIPVFGKIYPYFRFEGFTTQPVKTKHKVVILENDYLKIKIFPEIGGKVWSVVDKTCGKELFYDNKVVKFRDISLRGAWTSGGIEFNYGVIGHAPSCSFPIDYRTEQKPDGSVSCWISDFDLLTRTRWIVEINLPPDKGWFTTSSFWHNANSGSQPYYNWVNTGIDATDDLELIYPGTYSVGHGGETIPWPMDEKRGKNLSRWAENDFEGAKSYHIAGINAPYFGAFWANDNFGLMHFAERDEKVGKKFFTWALSDEGDIWEELLTDTNGQYLEIQSGRLFNQNSAESSSYTPYKQFYFTPYGTDVWTEYWFPFKATGGVTSASLYGVVYITEKNDAIDVSLSPLQSLSDTLKLLDLQGQIIASQPVTLSIANTFHTSLRFSGESEAFKLTFCNREIWSKEDKTMDRPNSEAVPFDYKTAYGNYLLGRDYAGMRLYGLAERHIRESLAKDPQFILSLVEMARLQYRHFAYDSAYFYARKALSFDTYDPDANFEYGRAALQLGKFIDALDGFEIAAMTTPLRSAAYTEISKLHFVKKDYDRSLEYAQKSLINNSFNIEGLQMSYLCYNQKQDARKADEIAGQILALDPFNLLILFEKTAPDMNRFAEKIRNEMPVQSFLELAIRYYSLDQPAKSRMILQAAPANAEVKWWLAFLSKDTPEEAALVQEAEAASPAFVFPFRAESKEVFEWAAARLGEAATQQGEAATRQGKAAARLGEGATRLGEGAGRLGEAGAGRGVLHTPLNGEIGWKLRYYLALLHGGADNMDEAFELLMQAGDLPDFPPFYALRARMASDDSDRERDLKKAVSLAPDEWRYMHQLTSYYLEKRDYAKALQILKPFYTTHKAHFPTASLYIRTLTYNKKYSEAEKILNTIHILPFEGETGGRLIYREIKMMLAVQALAKGKTADAGKKVADALHWPRNLGVGKPYDDQIDTRLEDWMNAMIAIKANNSADKALYLKQVAQSTHSSSALSALLQCLAYAKLGDTQKAADLFAQWSARQRNSTVKEWGERFYKNNVDKAYPFDLEEMTQLIGFLSGGRDVRLF